MRDINASKFVKTDIKEYLDKDAHVHCISCVNCIKEKKKLLQYKYNAGMKSNYADNYIKSGEASKQSIWNLDQEKRQLKVPYKAPGTFKSTYLSNFQNQEGKDVIGAPAFPNGVNLEGLYDKRGKRDGNDVHNPFIGSSSYVTTFPDYGSLPKANLKAQKKFVAGFGDFDGISTYKDTFNGTVDEFYRKAAEEKQRIKDYKRQQQRGNLAPQQPAPFKGESMAHREFREPKNAGVV